MGRLESVCVWWVSARRERRREMKTYGWDETSHRHDLGAVKETVERCSA